MRKPDASTCMSIHVQRFGIFICCKVAVLFSSLCIGKNTRSITCLSDHSRFSAPTAPRKYFVVTIVDAFTDKYLDTQHRVVKNSLTGFPVLLYYITTFPFNFIVWVYAFVSVDTLDCQTLTFTVLWALIFAGRLMTVSDMCVPVFF